MSQNETALMSKKTAWKNDNTTSTNVTLLFKKIYYMQWCHGNFDSTRMGSKTLRSEQNIHQCDNEEGEDIFQTKGTQ